MNIYIDESGTFVSAPKAGSWNAVAAFAVAEPSRRRVDEALKVLKHASSKTFRDEVKLRDVREKDYLEFLRALSRTQSVLFATAADAGVDSATRILRHQKMQVEKVLENLHKMRFEEGRQSIQLLANELASVRPQLYAQLVCQVDLVHDVLTRAVTYFAQRIPATLGSFRWRIDQKSSIKTTYEVVFEKMAPVLLQTKALSDPGLRVEGFDYRHFDRVYKYKPEEIPRYLEIDYGIRVEDPVNLGKLLLGDLSFEDSAQSMGVQVVDLLVSGIRRCLRGGFAANDTVALALGSLTLQNRRGRLPIKLMAFAAEDTLADPVAAAAIRRMTTAARPMIADHFRPSRKNLSS